MAYEQVDFGREDRLDNRILGSVGDTRHTITGPTPIGILRKTGSCWIGR